MTKAYEEALNAHSSAFHAFDAIRNEYRAGKISDAEFLAARKVYDEATKVYDAAFAVDAGW